MYYFFKKNLNRIKQIILPFICLLFLFSCASIETAENKNKQASQARLNPEDRYIVYDTGIVFDKVTSLEWFSGDVSSLDMYGTRFWLSRLYKDDPGWRLPTRTELYDIYQNGRHYCISLELGRDVFWIQNYLIYDLFTNWDYNPRLYRLRHRHRFFTMWDDYDDDDYELRAHIVVVRLKPNN